MKKLAFVTAAASALMVAFCAYGQDDYPLDVKKHIRIPKVTDYELTKVLEKATYYKLPQVWQHYVPASKVTHTNELFGTKTETFTKRVHRVYFSTYNPDVHANQNFPWETTVGLNSSFREQKNTGKPSPYSTVNFVYLPKPILVIDTAPVHWIFPTGTVVGEIVYVTYENVNYVQEIRTRTKDPDSKYWDVSLYRPVTSREELCKELGQDYTIGKRYMHFRNPQEDEVHKLEGLVELLPKLPPDTVKRLLDKPFKEAPTDHWSPCADEDFSILPKNWCFGLLNLDKVSCADCHRQTSISVRNLVPKDLDVIHTPEKIGNIRGCDGVFSWHPFDTASVSSDPKNLKQPRLRQNDVDSGRVMVYKPGNTLQPSDYLLTEYVQQSLKSYELPPTEFLHKEPTNDGPKGNLSIR